MANDPVTKRRQLRSELKRYRTDLDLTQRTVADDLDWSSSKVIRIENGTVAVSVTDLRALLQRYDVDDPATVNRLVDLARGSKRLPFSAYRDSVSPETLRYFGYESSASRIRQVHPSLVPGLLQTESYARALLSSWGVEKDIDQIWASREERQELFDREDPPACDFVLDEAVVRRLVGGPDVMRRQLDHLVAMSHRKRVSIRVIPFAAGGNRAQQGPFVLIEFPEADDEPVLYLERTEGDAVFREEAEMTGRYLEVFTALEELPGVVDISEFLGDSRSGGAGHTAPAASRT